MNISICYNINALLTHNICLRTDFDFDFIFDFDESQQFLPRYGGFLSRQHKGAICFLVFFFF